MIIYYVFIVLFGIVIGSFLNVCISRIPRGESVVTVPSHCMNCRTRLNPMDLIPILSYVFLGGKCRYCKSRISPRYPLIEFLTGLVYILVLRKFGFSLDFYAATYLMTVLIIVFFIDLDHKIIPDELVIAGLAGGVILVVLNIFTPVDIYGDRAWWNPLIGGIAGSGFLLLIAIAGLIIYRSDEAMGMGDVKILVPIGLFLGWKLVIVAVFMAVIVGGIFGVFLIATRYKARKDTIPFGPFIVTGTYIAYLYGWDIINWYLRILY